MTTTPPSPSPPLPGFSRLASDHRYTELHKLLWPRGMEDRLASYIETWTPKAVEAMDVDESDQLPPTPTIRFINLSKDRRLAIQLLQGFDNMIIRREYDDFLAHATQLVQGSKKSRAFFLTGQPGVGKSTGAGYFLFRLLASGQPVFFILKSDDTALYFSEAGVDSVTASEEIMGTTHVETVLKQSWVLIDVDLGKVEWLPELWVKSAACIVWTSSPWEGRKHHFTKQFDGAVWWMMPWSEEEIAALTALDHRDYNDIRERFSVSGPVPRNLFRVNATTSLYAIDQAIRVALSNGVFSLAASDVVDDVQKASHRMFLIQPKEVLDTGRQASLQRKEVSFHFLSNFIASRTAELMEEHLNKVRPQLIHAFNNPETRSAAGKLVESMMYRVLIQGRTDLPAAFGGGRVAAYLELVGKAETFGLEMHVENRRDVRPLYLRPLSANFASIDAIIVTVTHICLIQTSLSDTHSHNIRTVLQILTRLKTNKIPVDSLNLVYCIVGLEHNRVQELLGEAARTLERLQLNPNAAELQNPNAIGIERLKRLEVAGFTLETQAGVVMSKVE